MSKVHGVSNKIHENQDLFKKQEEIKPDDKKLAENNEDLEYRDLCSKDKYATHKGYDDSGYIKAKLEDDYEDKENGHHGRGWGKGGKKEAEERAEAALRAEMERQAQEQQAAEQARMDALRQEAIKDSNQTDNLRRENMKDSSEKLEQRHEDWEKTREKDDIRDAEQFKDENKKITPQAINVSTNESTSTQFNVNAPNTEYSRISTVSAINTNEMEDERIST
jgi:hypothetical protein